MQLQTHLHTQPAHGRVWLSSWRAPLLYWAAQVTRIPMNIFPTSCFLFFKQQWNESHLPQNTSMFSKLARVQGRCCDCSTPFTLTSPAGQGLPRITFLQPLESAQVSSWPCSGLCSAHPWMFMHFSCMSPGRGSTGAGWQTFLHLLGKSIAEFNLAFSLCTTWNF